MFWYSGKYNKQTNLTTPLAAQLIYNSHFDLLAEATICHDGYTILFYSGQEPVGCQALNKNWNYSALSPDLEFKLNSEVYFNLDKKWEIFTTQYNQEEIYNSAVQKNSLFYENTEDNWIVINWFLDKNRIYFLTLYSDPKQKLNLWIKSEYEVLSIKMPDTGKLLNDRI